jgi:hypothetical protein
MGFSQEIAENKTDEFTKKKIIRSGWEKLTFTKYASYIRLNKINESYFLNLKIITSSVSSVRENDNISFLFSDGSILDLKNSEYTLSNYGDGAIGINGSQALGLSLVTRLSEDEIQQLKNKTVSKIRVNTSNGYVEDVVKEKHAKVVKKIFDLF